MREAFTKLQGQYLAFIALYMKLHRRPPAEADIQAYFEVTPPTVHNMIVTLERRGLISKTPGAARSIRLLVEAERLPPLE
jgi:repressor LexA